MSNCPEHIIEYMHEYLDDDIEPEHEQVLKEHLHTCADCRKHFQELKKTVALVQGTSQMKAPDDLTERILAALPGEKKKVGMKRWFSRHPILTAAAIFIYLMAMSTASVWNQNNNFSVTKHEGIIIEDNTTAIIPEGEVIQGNVVVRNGNIRIEGKVDGNVTVINGEKYMAAAGEVTGEIEEINALFEWLWFNIKEFFKETLDL